MTSLAHIQRPESGQGGGEGGAGRQGVSQSGQSH